MYARLSKQLLAALITLLLATVVVFAAIRALPGDPATALSAEASDPAVLAQIRSDYGLDKPLPVQYLRWVSSAARGDFGTSPQTGISVSTDLLARLPVTLELTFLALLIAVLLGVPTGIWAAARQHSAVDHLASAGNLLLLSVPHFWLGLLLILLFAVKLHWLPASGYVPFFEHPLDNLRHMAMPAVSLAMGLNAIIMRQMRSSMCEALHADYVRTARAKGLSERRIIWLHALRNSLTTVVTITGLQVATLLSGAIITEQIFLIPGLGRLAVEASFTRDYPSLQGVVLIAATSYVLINLLTDALYGLLNPRVRSGAAAH